MEEGGVSGEILDSSWRLVFISSEEAKITGVAPSDARRFYGKSLVVRQLEDGDVWGTTEESSREWWRRNVPIMRRYLEPGDARFEAVFGSLSENAARVEPGEDLRAWSTTHSFPDLSRLRVSVLGDVTFFDLRISADDGQFLGVLRLSRMALPDSLMARLSRGDRGMYERMDRVREPARRSASILFADLESSGELSRRLSSRAYFELVRGLTDLIDSEVIARGGIVGKHAGDGASALFLVEDAGGSESRAARVAIEAGRAVRDRAGGLGPDELSPGINVGIHWGATLTVGQVATGGRLEVTALGDEVNEAARVEEAASGGVALASKDAIERLDAADAEALGLDPAALAYRTVAEIEGAGEKAIRDAGSIPVTEV
jgi:class 3 adenylate cyclase